MLIVEDGSGVPNANSYIELQTAIDFLQARGLPEPNNAFLLQSMDFIESLRFKGKPTTLTQVTAFPRMEIVDKNGVPYNENSIPMEVQRAVMWSSYYIQSGFNPSSVAAPQVKREKLDVLEREFFGDSSNSASKVSYTVKDLPNVYGLLSHLLIDDLDSSTDANNSAGYFDNGTVNRA